jgi:hypothetical protein
MPLTLPAFTGGRVTLWYEAVHRPRVMVRATPSTSARVVGVVEAGEIVGVESIERHAEGPWARLASAEMSRLQINLQQSMPTTEAFVLLDGASLGLGTLLEEVAHSHRPHSHRSGRRNDRIEGRQIEA